MNEQSTAAREGASAAFCERCATPLFLVCVKIEATPATALHTRQQQTTHDRTKRVTPKAVPNGPAAAAGARGSQKVFCRQVERRARGRLSWGDRTTDRFTHRHTAHTKHTITPERVTPGSSTRPAAAPGSPGYSRRPRARAPAPGTRRRRWRGRAAAAGRG